MPLPRNDIEFLEARGMTYEVVDDAGMICVLFPNWELPAGYDQSESCLMLRLAVGYPDVPPDMWWFEPAVRLADGTVVPATEVVEPHFGRSWQRWSRHLQAGQWRSGIDGIESFLAVINADLSKHVQGVVA